MAAGSRGIANIEQITRETASALRNAGAEPFIIPAMGSAHAVAYAKKLASSMARDQIIVINLSGRGDKDVAAIARYKGVALYE